MIRLTSLALAVLALCSTSATFANTGLVHTFCTKSPDATTDIDFTGLQPTNEISGGTSTLGAQQHLFCTDVGVNTFDIPMTAVVINKVGATQKIAAQGALVSKKAEVAMKEEGQIGAGGLLVNDEVEFDLVVAALTAKGMTVMAAASADGTTAKTADAWASTAIAALFQAAKTAPLTAADWDHTGANSIDMGLVARNTAGAHKVNLLAAGRSGFGLIVCYSDSGLRHGLR